MKIMTAVMHMDENASRWFRVYNRKNRVDTWDQFIKAVEQKFGAYDYQYAIDALLDLKQVGSVEDYAAAFKTLQFQVDMHSGGMPDTYFVSQFIRGLKPDIRYAVQGQVPHSMEQAVMLARIQQQIQEKNTKKSLKPLGSTRWASTSFAGKLEQPKAATTLTLSKDDNSEITTKPITCVSIVGNLMMQPMLLNALKDQKLKPMP